MHARGFFGCVSSFFLMETSHMGIIAHLEAVPLYFCAYPRSPATAAPLPTVYVKGLHLKRV